MSKESILGTLVIVVLKAQHLIDNHKFYKQDPYAKLSLSGASKQTPVDPKGGQHPVWDAELRFPISRDPSKSNRTLSVSVFSEEKKDDELLGEATVDIDETLKTGEFDDWVPLSLKGTQRGEVYLEMTFFSAGPSPLTRRPSKFTNPTERLARPQQPVAQRPQRVTSQPSSSNVTPHVQPSWSSSQDTSRQGRAKVVQVPLPGSWPGQSSQHQQPSQLAAPSNPNRRSPKDQDSALPPLPLDAVPKQEFVPAILRPGGPSGVPPGTTVLPSHEARSVPSDTPEQGRYRAGTSSPPFSNHVAPLATGYHSTTHSDLSSNAYHPPHLTHQDTLPLPVSLAPLAPQSHPHVHSSSPQLQPQPQPQPRARAISGQGPPGYDGYSSGVQAITQPSPQPHRELAYVNHNSQPQSPPQQQQQIQHSPPHQTQPPPSQSAPYVSSYPPNNQIPVHPYVASPDSLSPGQSYGATASPASPAHPYASTSSPTPPTQSHVLNPSPAPATQSYHPTSSPAPSGHPYVATSSPNPLAQSYTVTPVPAPQGHTLSASPVPSIQSYVSPTGSSLSPFVPSHASPPPPAPAQVYIAPINPLFPLQTSPPPMPSYGLSYTPAPAPSFPTPSFPVPQHTVDYFRAGTATPFSLHDEPELPDPYLVKRYQTPLPLPPGTSNPPNSSRHAKPEPKPPSAPAPGTRSTIQNEGERAARKLQHREDENARARREQEERDAELARTLDLELNLDRSRNDAQGGPGAPPSFPPPRAEMVGRGMPGAW